VCGYAGRGAAAVSESTGDRVEYVHECIRICELRLALSLFSALDSVISCSKDACSPFQGNHPSIRLALGTSGYVNSIPSSISLRSDHSTDHLKGCSVIGDVSFWVGSAAIAAPETSRYSWQLYLDHAWSCIICSDKFLLVSCFSQRIIGISRRLSFPVFLFSCIYICIALPVFPVSR